MSFSMYGPHGLHGRLPAAASAFVAAFDLHVPVQPSTFTLEVEEAV